MNISVQGFIPEKIGSKNGSFTEIGDLKTDPSQKSDTLNLTLKNYNVVFHARSAGNEFTKKLFKKFLYIHFFKENKNFFTKIFFSQN